MSILTVDWDLRALWTLASFSMKAYFVGLFVMSVYTVLRLAKVILILHALKEERSKQGAHRPISDVVATMRHLRQLQYSFLLIFGACFASEFFGIVRAVRNSVLSLSAATVEMFEPAAAFAFLAFAILACLHALQWFVSSRVDITTIGPH